MNCGKCGNQMDENDKFCSRCGELNPVTDQTPEPVLRKEKKKPLILFASLAAALCAAVAVFAVTQQGTGGGNISPASAAALEIAQTGGEEEPTSAFSEETACSEGIAESGAELPESEPDAEKSVTDTAQEDTDGEKEIPETAEPKPKPEPESEPESSSAGQTGTEPAEEILYSRLDDAAQADLQYFLDEKKEPRKVFSEVTAESLYDAGLIPESTLEKPAAGLENVAQAERYFFSEEQKELLEKNGFFVTDGYYGEFYEVYEVNRYRQQANFVTTDSLMHTYHLYFQHLLKGLEREQLTEKLSGLTEQMLSRSVEQYGALCSDADWAEAAFRNVAFFSVAARLLSDQSRIPAEAAETVAEELSLISAAAGKSVSPVMGYEEDYTQYKPRGYYAGTDSLERYFRVMMWYGRMSFLQEKESLNRSAMLIALALNEDECYESWETVYSVTSFFAGESDDLTFYDYLPAVRKAYGERIEAADIMGNEKSWEEFCGFISELKSPMINSLPDRFVSETEGGKSFRFLGQRFSIDAAIFQELVYDNLKKTEEGERRKLPDALDIPASLGSEEALTILKEEGIEKYQDYVPKVEELRTLYSGENTGLWQASLYSQWLYALRPLLEEKKEGYPAFMLGSEWTRKNLESFLGSYTELKHDTILYAKQVVMAEGDGEEEKETIDDRGYVEPEYRVYACITALTENTKSGLQKYGVLSSEDAEKLDEISALSSAFMTISEKELKNEILTEDEYDLIRRYGTYLEHLWDYATDPDPDSSGIVNESAAVVVDVATNSTDMEFLEIATGEPSFVYAVAPVAGELKIVRGAVFSFYQFSSSERLTDSEWRQMMGYELNEEGNFDSSEGKEHMAWTGGYRSGDYY